MPTLAEEVDAKFKQLSDKLLKDVSDRDKCRMELWLKEFYRAGYRDGTVAFRERLGEG
jgi:hypothetical protein